MPEGAHAPTGRGGGHPAAEEPGLPDTRPSAQLLAPLLHPRQHGGRRLLVVEVEKLVARRVDVRVERTGGGEEVRARDVLAVGRVLLAELLLLVLVEADHHEALRHVHHLRVVEHGAVVGTVRAPLRIEDEADRLFLLLRRRQPVLVALPPDLLVVPVAAGARGRSREHGEAEQRSGDGACAQHGTGASKRPCECSIQTLMSAPFGSPRLRSSSASGWSPRTSSAPPRWIPTPVAPETNGVQCSAPSMYVYVVMRASGSVRPPPRRTEKVSTWR